MKTVSGEKFSEPLDASSWLEEPLVIHAHQEPTSNHQLIIFVHGLGGSRYGKKATWGNFPSFLFADLPTLDIGMYQYRTLAGRLAFSKSVSLESEARVFADLIRDQLRAYKSVILVGHSMGGLLCKAVIHTLVTTADTDTLARITGLILMATPQLGSLRVPRLLGLFSYDARALKPHSELVIAINRTFEDHIAIDENVNTLRKATIPTWAVEGIGDRWVDPLSAGIGLASSRRKVVRGSHTSIVKPQTNEADAYVWVRERLNIVLHRFKYDVFVGAAMAGHAGDAEYTKSRDAVLKLVEILKTKCGFNAVFYAGMDMKSKGDFDPELLALQIDLRAMRASRYFLLYYPERIASSVLYEAGWALILGKPSIYIARTAEDLPFLLQQAGDAFESRRVRIFQCADTPSMLKEVASFGEKLFDFHDPK